MPGPLRPAGSRLPAEEGFFELLIDTLDGLDRPARGLFLQRLFRSITQLELSEAQSLDYWDRVVERRKELTNLLGRTVSLKTALVDVFAYENFLRVPILMEYEELKKLQINAATDPLTGLYNRRLFEEYFDKELNRAQRNQQNLALMILDLHVFKQVNDRFGHLRGDQVLQMAAAALRSSMRASDYAFRIGGDEFALLLPQSDAEQAATLGRRLQTKFAETVAQLNLDLPLAIDFGLAVHPQDGEQMSVLLRAADQRLYQMKGTSRRDRSRPIVGTAAAGAGTGENAHAEAGSAGEAASAHVENEGRQAFAAAAGEAHTEAVTEEAAPVKQEAALEVSPPHEDVPVTEPEIETVETTTVAAEAPVTRPSGAERRKTERIALTRTHAHAQMAGSEVKIRILDLSNGGLALETEEGTELNDSFQAILHVPILPAVRVHLRPVYKQPLGRGFSRVGCSFVA